MATEVVLIVQRALAPVLTRLSVAETHLARTAAYEQVLGDVRDRLVIMEAKAPPPVIDLTPVCERLASAETQIGLMAKATAAPIAPADDLAPEDVAASVAGLLRKELADLDVPPRMSRKVIRDGQGAVKYEIEETT